MTNNKSWILFDYGGCLDADGMHSRTLYYNMFSNYGLLNNTNKDEFEDAYSFADQEIINKSLVLKSSLLEMNTLMCKLIAETLNLENQILHTLIAYAISNAQSYFLNRNIKVVSKIREKYNLGVVSNFSGNLVKILNDFSLGQYFSFVIDSYYSGVTKPNPQIFELAIQLCGENPEQIWFIGDNLERDIRPARNLRMNTCLISTSLKKSEAEHTITSLEELLPLISTF
jgi:HAD superfamily hydrolase (TIGR01509 family)